MYSGDRSRNLALAGLAMGEAVEESIEERIRMTEAVPPPDACGYSTGDRVRPVIPDPVTFPVLALDMRRETRLR